MKIDMRQYQPNDAWLVFRVDCYVRNQPIDIYMLIDVASAYVFGQVIAPSELPEDTEVAEMLRTAYEMKHQWPKRLFYQSPDPAEALFRAHADTLGIPFQPVAISDFDSGSGTLETILQSIHILTVELGQRCGSRSGCHGRTQAGRSLYYG